MKERGRSPRREDGAAQRAEVFIAARFYDAEFTSRERVMIAAEIRAFARELDASRLAQPEGVVEAPHIPGQQDDGGPAFPTTAEAYSQGFEGMTLRQWYIGQALSGWVAALGRRCGEEGYTDSSAAGEAARLAVITADAALHFGKERSNG